MKNNHSITKEQLGILDSLTCERLSRNPENRKLIETFACERGPGLVNTLVNSAWDTDLLGSTAYYLVKNPDGEILLFFSLKCGTLFNPNFLSNFAQQYREISHMWQRINGPEAAEIRSSMDADEFHMLQDRVNQVYDHKYGKLMHYKMDKMFEPNQKIVRVDKAHPAIELVDFAANDNAKDYWDSLNLGHSMGETLFWWFIVPRMMDINALIGCEFAYLFAADSEPFGSLYRYYHKKLHFEAFEDLGTVKPFYDMTCLFMVKNLHSVDLSDFSAEARAMMDDDDLNRLLGLDHFREDFFRNFNS